MKNYKDLFPIFKNIPDLHYLDSGATSLKPQMVLDKMTEYYTQYSANIHRGLYPMSDRATEEYESVREKVSKFIGARHASEIIFTSGTTDSINLVARALNINKDDEIAVEVEAHHSNFVVWQQLGKLKFQVTKKTRVLAITHVSNVLGQVNDIKSIISQARKINPNICVVVDGAQAVAHVPVDVMDIDCDFYCFSGHKMYGPTGVGVLYAKAERQKEMIPGRFGGGMIKEVAVESSTWASGPEKFEAGTPPIAEVIGLGTAIDFINKIGFGEIVKHEKELTEYMLGELNKFNWVKVLGTNENKLGLLAMYSQEKEMGTSHDIADILGRDFNVCVRAGHHCAMPLHTKLGVETGTVRASVGIYNDKNDIDELVKGLNTVWTIFIKK